MRAVVAHDCGGNGVAGAIGAGNVRATAPPLIRDRIKVADADGERGRLALDDGGVGWLLRDNRRRERRAPGQQAARGDWLLHRAVGKLPHDGQVVAATAFLLQRLDIISAPGNQTNGSGLLLAVPGPFSGSGPTGHVGDRLYIRRSLIRAKKQSGVVVA